ncbi:Hypothetical predicted protein [Scomber scombrus]|uniref:Uncharacterized protein n=1 Tax=Scomber scombrus TaxID=13677 RepID=A0AAV1PQU0_SCOSC
MALLSRPPRTFSPPASHCSARLPACLPACAGGGVLPFLLFQQKAHCSLSHICFNGYHAETTSHLSGGELQAISKRCGDFYRQALEINAPTDGLSVDPEERRQRERERGNRGP